jgi:hypothetical protein
MTLNNCFLSSNETAQGSELTVWGLSHNDQGPWRVPLPPSH